VPDDVAPWHAARLTDHSLRCLEHPVWLQRGGAAVPCTCIRCSRDPDGVVALLGVVAGRLAGA
jgi:hypothetical protein